MTEAIQRTSEGPSVSMSAASFLAGPRRAFLEVRECSFHASRLARLRIPHRALGLTCQGQAAQPSFCVGRSLSVFGKDLLSGFIQLSGQRRTSLSIGPSGKWFCILPTVAVCSPSGRGCLGSLVPFVAGAGAGGRGGGHSASQPRRCPSLYQKAPRYFRFLSFLPNVLFLLCPGSVKDTTLN